MKWKLMKSDLLIFLQNGCFFLLIASFGWFMTGFTFLQYLEGITNYEIIPAFFFVGSIFYAGKCYRILRGESKK